jgi:uncharacterized delta-60 repeat protein
MIKILPIFFCILLLPKFNKAQNGTLDSTFGINGLTKTAFFGQWDEATCLVIQPNLKIVVGGYTYSPSGYLFAVVRYNQNGIIDSTFGTNGKTTIRFIEGNAFCTCMALQQDGKIVLGGYVQSFFNHEDFAIARILPNGQLDNLEFYPGGQSTKDFTHQSDRINSLVVRPNGKILAIGSSSQDGTVYKYALAQYNYYGFIDATFGINGIVTTDFGGEHLAYGTCSGLQNDGKVIVGGYAYNQQFQQDYSISRYNIDGSIDSSFGVFGKVILDFGFPDNAAALAIQPDGKIIMAGNSLTNSGDDTYILMGKFNRNGQLDSSFGINGKVIQRPDYNVAVNAIALKRDGNFDITGSIGSDVILLQYKNTGILDSSFGVNGKTLNDWGNNYDKASGIAIQNDGKVVLAGASGGPNIFCVSRYKNENIFKTTYWIGTSDNNWHNALNWSSGLVPDWYTDVIINSTNECLISNSAFCHSIKVSPNSRITVQNNLDVIQ